MGYQVSQPRRWARDASLAFRQAASIISLSRSASADSKRSGGGQWRGRFECQPGFVDRKCFALAQDYGPLDNILQFPNIPRPVVGLKRFDRPLRNVSNHLAGFLCVSLDEMLDEQGYVVRLAHAGGASGSERRSAGKTDPWRNVPAATAALRSRFVAAMMRTFTEIGWLLPTRSNSRS